MPETGPPPPDDRVPLFGTWRAIYTAVVVSALAVMALVCPLLAVAVLSPVVSVLAPADWVVLVAYVVGIVAFGVWVGRRTRNVSDFYLAGREMRWWAAGLSVMATQISAITFVGTTGQAYTKGMSFLAFYFGLPFAMVVLSLTLVPFFYRAGVYTAYQYLERRFDGRTRTLTSLLFLLSRGLSVGVTLYAPSLVLSVIFGWSETATIAVMGGATIVYVAYGGNRSVIWTDVAQMALVWFGIFTCVTVAIAQLPAGVGLRDALALAQATGRLEMMDTSLDPSRPYTVWSGLIGGMFLAMGYFGCDQSQVQRYLSGRTLTESRLSLLFTAFLKVPMQFLILLTGVLVFVFFHFHETPLLWNRAELARLEAQAPPAELARVRAEAGAAHRERLSAAEAFARARHGGGDVATERDGYLAAQRRVDAAEADTRRLASSVARRTVNDINYIFPSYIVDRLRGGLAGLIIAVIFAAAMSALAGELNSLATATMVDFYPASCAWAPPPAGSCSPPGCSRRSGGSSRASWPCRPVSSARRSRSSTDSGRTSTAPFWVSSASPSSRPGRPPGGPSTGCSRAWARYSSSRRRRASPSSGTTSSAR